MKTSTLTLITACILCLLRTSTFAQKTVWTQSAGSAEIDLGGKTATDDMGNTYVLSSFNSDFVLSNNTTLTSNGDDDMFLMMLDTEGEIKWTKTFGSTAQDKGNDIAIDKDGNLLLTGSYSGTLDFGGDNQLISKGGTDVFIAKMDADGEAIWALSAGGSGNDESVTIGTDSKGMVYIGGEFEGQDGFFGITPLIAFGKKDMFVARVDGDGSNIWVMPIGGTDNEEVENLAIDAEGNMYLSGSFESELIVGNDTISLDLGATFTTKISAEGTMGWTKQEGNEKTILNAGLVTDANGDLYTAGSFEGTAKFGSETLVSEGEKDMVIVKQNAEGTVLWAISAGGSANDQVSDLTLDAEGNLIIGGSFEGTSTFGTMTKTSEGMADNLVAKIDADGTFKWAATSGGSLNETVNSVAVAAQGEIIASGTFEGTSSFKKDESSNGESDMYVWKIEEEPVGIFDARSQTLVVYPNVVSDVVAIQGMPSIDFNQVEIVTMNGTTVKTFNQNDLSNARLNVSSLQSGLYIMHATADTGTHFTARIIKQ